MAVMRETGFIVISTRDGSLFHFSGREGHFFRRGIKPPCKHCVRLLCVQITGYEYLALSCPDCKTIKLMNLDNQKRGLLRRFSSGSDIKYDVISAFSGEVFSCMCLGEEKRIFVQSNNYTVLELDISNTTFTKVKTFSTIYPSYCYGLSYVPDPHRLLVVSDRDEVRAVSCDDETLVWRVQKDDDLDPSRLLYIPSLETILLADLMKNRVVVLNSRTGLEIQSISLPHYVCEIQGLRLTNDQIIVASGSDGGRISFFLLK